MKVGTFGVKLEFGAFGSLILGSGIWRPGFGIGRCGLGLEGWTFGSLGLVVLGVDLMDLGILGLGNLG